MIHATRDHPRHVTTPPKKGYCRAPPTNRRRKPILLCLSVGHLPAARAQQPTPSPRERPHRIFLTWPMRWRGGAARERAAQRTGAICQIFAVTAAGRARAAARPEHPLVAAAHILDMADERARRGGAPARCPAHAALSGGEAQI